MAALPWGDLCCPSCPRGERRLTLADGWLVGECGHRFPVRDGIPMLLPDEAGRWEADPPAVDPDQRAVAQLDLSVIIPALEEAENLALLLPRLVALLEEMAIEYEILVVTGRNDGSLKGLPDSLTRTVRGVEQVTPGYGGAVRTGISRARGRYVATMDADLSHPVDFLERMWARREEAEVVIASRYVKGGAATMPASRKVLSRILNIVFRRGLSVRVKDMSSGFRLMRTDAVRRLDLTGRDFDLVQEVLVRAYSQGWRVIEVPFHYEPRHAGRSHAALLRFGVAYTRTFWSLWRLRNSVAAADYDDRAYDSAIPLQRYWQRTRLRHVIALVGGHGPVLDVGSGSSRIIGSLPPGSVALDVLLPKLRHARRFGVASVNASGFALPYADGTFSCVLSSQVIERVPRDSPLLDELCRVVSPDGRLVLGTPDYDSRVWRSLEGLYGRIVAGWSAADYVTHYTRESLIELMRGRGFVLDDERDILGAEIILAFRRAPASS